MDTQILFRDDRRYASDFNNMTSLIMANDSTDSTSTDGVDTDPFTSEICSWNYDSGLTSDFELMLDRFHFDPIAGDDFCSIVNEFENRVDDDIGDTVDQKVLLSELEVLKQEDNEIINKIKKEPDTLIINNTHSDVEQKKEEIPGLDDIASVPFFEYSDIHDDSFPKNLAVSDLPPNLDLCSFINNDEIIGTIVPKIEILDEPEVAVPNVPEIPIANKPITVIPKKEPQEPRFKAGRKKIDLKAQRYIVEEDEEEEEEENVDVETISENGSNPVLEARDLDSLLEQFEATEVEEVKYENVTEGEKSIHKEEPKCNKTTVVTNVEITKNNKNKNKLKHEQNKSQFKGALADASVYGGRKNTDCKVDSAQKYVNPSIKIAECKKGETKSSKWTTATSNNKQIIEALPKELINRIKESGKRKSIAIIDPFPNIAKKRKLQDNSAQLQTAQTTATSTAGATAYLQSIELDHSYCSVPVPRNKRNPKKDSGYMSAEEEDKTLHSQPIVKNADGKLMISLLKVNTIRANIEENKKKKLNIEEYKKRRMGILNTPTSSLSNSPISSSCSSPLPEDENTKRLKHEEKLRKMALELLNTPPKSSCIVIKPIQDEKIEVPVKAVVPAPTDMDVITYVSIGVNTDVSGRNPLSPMEKLEEIKPLLQNASVKINSNSLINSLIENIPKVIKPDKSVEADKKVSSVHGEDKTIIYLPKNRKPPQCSEVGVQTMITLLGDNKRRYRRRRDSSSSSSSSDSSEHKGSNRSSRSQGSRYSKSSRSSRSNSISSSSSSCRSSIRTRSISRSPSPQRRRKRRGYDHEYVQEVEERRVVYVGKIAKKTTKEDLYRRFSRFGPIKTISLHFRNHGDNYGFVTFANKLDAYEAIEHGNDDPYDIKYDLSFGGRRLFCKTSYSDLDNMREDSIYGGPSPLKSPPGKEESFDRLLKEMQEKLKRRKV